MPLIFSRARLTKLPFAPHITGLSATRLWNKKYPIVISSLARSGEDAKDVVLFARTCRDKEYWFRLLKKTSEKTKTAIATAAKSHEPEKDSPVFANDEVVTSLVELGIGYWKDGFSKACC